MQKDIIRQIWDIRGLVDKSINNHNIELYETARQQLLKIREKGNHFKSIAAETLQAQYESEAARDFDVEANFLMIIHNLNELRKDILGEEREEYELQFSSIAEILWYTRQMYDVFILNAELKSVEEDENKKLFFMIEENLKSFLDYYQYFRGATDIKEKITLIEILTEINKTYDKYYTENLKTDEI